MQPAALSTVPHGSHSSMTALNSRQAPQSLDRANTAAPELSMNIRVLLIEDDDYLRNTTCLYLAAVGLTAHALPSVEGIDRQLARHPVDLVICDADLPGESGFLIITKLRKVPGVGVVMLTARGRDEDRLRGLSLGADCCLVKPVSLRELGFVIRNLHRRLTNAAVI